MCVVVVQHVCDIMHPCEADFRAPISLNAARWLHGAGEGLVYGTNRGDLNIYRPGSVPPPPFALFLDIFWGGGPQYLQAGVCSPP